MTQSGGPQKPAFVVAVLVPLLLLASSAQGATIPCGKDTWLDESSPWEPHGHDVELSGKNSPGDRKWPLLQFDLSTIPAGSRISSAVLHLHVTDADASGDPILVYRNVNSWNEYFGCWALDADDVDFSREWGSFTPTDEGESTVAITELVQSWIDGDITNYGIALVPTSEGDEFKFASREWDGTERPYLEILVESPSVDFRVATGLYPGNGQDDRPITGLGFQPDFVIVKGDHNTPSVARSATMPAGQSKALGTNQGLRDDRILSLDADGFTIGASDWVNNAGVSYTWIALAGDPDLMVVGSYTGNGWDDRNISVPGMIPDYVIVMGENNVDAIQRFIEQEFDESLTFGFSSPASNRIQWFFSGGFQVGSSDRVNASGIDYHYIAFEETPGFIATGTYVGNGNDDRPIDDVGFQPEYALVKCRTDTYSCVQRPGTVPGDLTLHVGSGNKFADGIQSLSADGFEVGRHDAVNAGGQAYYYVAVRDTISNSVDLAVTVDVTDRRPNEGDTIRFSVTCRNGSAVEATGVRIDDALPEGLEYASHAASQGDYDPGTGSWSLGILAAGQTETLTIDALVLEGTAGSTLTYTASVAAVDQQDQNTSNNTDSVDVTVQSADLAIAKDVDDPSPNEGDVIQFRIGLSNEGPDEATAITAKDSLPAGLSYDHHTVTQGGYDPATGVWTVGDLPVAEEAVLTVDARVDEGTGGETITNAASVLTADQADPDQGNNSVSVQIRVQSADLKVVKTVDNPSPVEGEEIAYTVSLTNQGPDAASGIRVEDLLPEGVTYASHQVSQGSYDPDTGLWDAGSLGTLDDASANLTLRATVDPGLDGTITNTAEIVAADQADPNPANNASSAEIGALSADLSLGKAVDRPFPNEGDTVVFLVTLRNEGPDDGTGISISDPLPEGLTFVSADPERGTYDAEAGIWTVGNLTSGSALDLELAASVDPGTKGRVLTNTAEVLDADQADPDGANNIASVKLTIGTADLSVSLVADAAQSRETARVTYTVTLENLGPSDASGVALVGPIADGLTYDSHEAERGTFDPGIGEWAVPALGAQQAVTLDLVVTVDGGTAGSEIVQTFGIEAADQVDLEPGNDEDSWLLEVDLPLFVEALDQVGQTIRPADPPVDLFGIRITNPSASSERITAVQFHSRVTGPGSQAELDAEWSELSLWKSAGVPAGWVEIATAEVASGVALFDGLSAAIASGAALDLVVRGGASVAARDGDLLDLRVEGSGDLTFDRTVPTQASWPLDPAGSFSVDGMVREQIDIQPIYDREEIAGTDGVLVFDFTVPANGYEVDILQQIRVENLGTAQPGTEIASMHLVPHGQGGVPLCAFFWDGSYWTTPALGESIPAEGLRLTVMVDLLEEATPGTTIRLALPANPVEGVTVTSDNDGPIDEAAANPGTVTIVSDLTPKILISAEAQGDGTLLPGNPAEKVLKLVVQNETAFPETLQLVTIENATSGPGEPAQLDANWATLSLLLGTQLIRTAEMQDGVAAFGDLDLIVGAEGSLVLTIRGAASLVARDGDRLDLLVRSADSFVFSRPVEIAASWPLDPSGSFLVDGMTRVQIEQFAIENRDVLAGESGHLALDVRVPANGYEPDLLEGIRIENLGDAQPGSDLAVVQAWVDGGNGTLDRGTADDLLLGDFEWADGFYLLDDLAHLVPVSGVRLFVSVDIGAQAAPGRTVHLALPRSPAEGLLMESSNDGPIDFALEGVGILTVVEALPEILTLAALPQDPVSLLPGGPAVEMLRLRLTNHTTEMSRLNSLVLESKTTGPGDSGQLDAEWSSLSLLAGEEWVATGTVSEGMLRFEQFEIEVASRDSVDLVVEGGASLVARDGDTLDLCLSGPEGVGLSRADSLVASWPLDPEGEFVVDGMAAAQIALHPLEAGSFASGSGNNLVLDFTIPPNGYEPDVLNRLDLLNLGTARPSTDLAAMALWADDGSGEFDPDADRRIGALIHTGGRWEITAISETVGAEGLRLFVTVDITTLATEGRTIRLAVPTVPDVGIGVISNNDGPRDRQVAGVRSHVISSSDRITLTPGAIPPGTVHPGTRDLPLLHVMVTNTYGEVRSIQGITVTNSSQGSGDQSMLDGGIDVLLLHSDGNGNGIYDGLPSDPIVSTGSFDQGKATLRGFQLDVPPGETRHLFLTANVSLHDATDGDVLAVSIVKSFDVEFETSSVISAEWPLESGASWVVDGMVADQIKCFHTGVATLGPGEGPEPVFDFSIPGNGYLADTLELIHVVNGGTAGDEQIEELRLWKDGGDGLFTPMGGDDRDLGSLAWIGNGWTVSGLQEPLSPGGERFFLSLNVAPQLADSSSVRLRIPVGGIGVASENDGPLDRVVDNPDLVLLSPAPLITVLKVEPQVSTTGQSVAVEMVVRNRSEERIREIVPNVLEQMGTTVLTRVEGPVPDEIDLLPGEADTFRWAYSSQEPGDVRWTGDAEGIGNATGFVARSLPSASNLHRVFREAQELQMFPIGTLPFSVNRGQEDIIPLSLTFRNEGDEEESNIHLKSLRVRVEDQNGEGIVPADLLTRIVVNEGSRVYLEKTADQIETEGVEVNLALQSPVVITTFEPVTLNLKLDVSPETTVQTFRLVIEGASWAEAEDATSGAPVSITLQNGSYPVRSGLARIVAEATNVRALGDPPQIRRVNVGQNGVELLTFHLENVGLDWITSEARVGAFEIETCGGDGQPMAEPFLFLDQIRVRTPLHLLGQFSIEEATGSIVEISMANPISLPVNTPIEVTIEADLREDAPLGEILLRLGSADEFDVRDANTREAVGVEYEPERIESGLIVFERAARALAVSGDALLPEILIVGERNVEVIDVHFAHPDAADAARIRIDGLAVECWGEDRRVLPIGTYLDRLRVVAGDDLLGEVNQVGDGAQQVLIPMAGLILEPGEAETVRLIVDVEAGAPSAPLEFTIASSGIHASDANSDAPVQVEAAAGENLPLFSGLGRLLSPARELLVTMESRMPAVLAGSQEETPVAVFRLANTASEGSGSIRVNHLVLRAADRSFRRVAPGRAADRIVTTVEGLIRAEARGLEKDSTTVTIVFPEDLVLLAGETIDLDLSAEFRAEAEESEVRFGLDREGIGIVQPEGALMRVEARPAGGLSFPLWTEAGAFTARSLRESFSNFPNPFAAGRERTRFAFYLPSDGRVSIRVWTSRGEEVIGLLDAEEMNAGLHQHLEWDGRNGRGDVVYNGVYLVECSVRFADGSRERLLHKLAVAR